MAITTSELEDVLGVLIEDEIPKKEKADEPKKVADKTCASTVAAWKEAYPHLFAPGDTHWTTEMSALLHKIQYKVKSSHCANLSKITSWPPNPFVIVTRHLSASMLKDIWECVEEYVKLHGDTLEIEGVDDKIFIQENGEMSYINNEVEVEEAASMTETDWGSW